MKSLVAGTQADRKLRSSSRCWEAQISADQSPRPARFGQRRGFRRNACSIVRWGSMLLAILDRRWLDMESANDLALDTTCQIWINISTSGHFSLTSTCRWASRQMKKKSLLRLVGKQQRFSRQRAFSTAHYGPVAGRLSLFSAVLSSSRRSPCVFNAPVLLPAADQSHLPSAPAVLPSPNQQCRLRRVPSANQTRPAYRSCAGARRPGMAGGFVVAPSGLTRPSLLRSSSPIPAFEGTPCRPRSFFVGVGARRPSFVRSFLDGATI